MTADDVLDRRTRVGLVDADRERQRTAVESAVAEILATLS
jgi:glycerol-3-phosphate dehydrogenase